MSDRELTATRLLRSSAEHSYDPEVEIETVRPLGSHTVFVARITGENCAIAPVRR